MNRILIGLSGLCVLAAAFFVLPILVAQPPAGPPGGGGPGGPGGFEGPGGFPGGRGFMPPIPAMLAIDKDADGEISAEELAAAPAALRALDKNRDGVLRAEELMPEMPFGSGGPGG
ncbi:MAG: hypothetical protein IT423_14725, partial [Pirellulaceae bacterium]|nr:hypothetical protein [Pirellulaceae bacterium]